MSRAKPTSLPLFSKAAEDALLLEQRKRKTSARLPLVGPTWFRGVDTVSVLEPRNPRCMLCALGGQVQTVCMPGIPAAPVKGGVLLVSSTPTYQEDQLGEGSRGGQNAELLSTVGRLYKGPWKLTYAVRCAGGRLLPDKTKGWVDPVEACRTYLAREIDDQQPERIVALGADAARALTGLRVDPIGIRRAWGEVRGFPTFFTLHPGAAFRNQFVAGWFRSDLEWALTTAPQARPKGEVQVLLSPEEVGLWLSTLHPHDLTIVDVEHEGHLWDGKFKLLCISICQDPEAPVVIPAWVAEQAKDPLRRWMEDPTRPKGGQAIKHDRHAIYRALGIDLAGISVDTLVWARQRESDAPAGLASLAWTVGMGGYKGEAHAAAEDDDGKDFGKVEPDVLHQYAARDVAVNLRVARWQLPKVPRYLPTWENLLRPAMWALCHVERWGALLSEMNVRMYDRWLTERIANLEAKLWSYPEVPRDFKVTSPEQVSKLFFSPRTEGGLGLPADPRWKNTKGYSVDKDTMEALAGKHALVDLIAEQSNYRTQRKNYGLKVLGHVGHDGRVHSTYKLVRSLRLSCSEPNLQQVTSPGVKPGEKDYESLAPEDEGVWARGCWVAPPGHQLVQVDYAQMELRVAAMLSGDEEMAAAFEAGHDFHTMTASAAFEIPPTDVNAEQRRAAKVLNFALIFGMGEYGIAKGAKISTEKARDLMGSLLGKYRKFDAWRKAQVARAERTGESLVEWAPEGWVQRRNIWQIGEVAQGKDADKTRAHARNVALNGPIQTVANFFSLASLASVVQWIQDEGIPARVTITVHDALVLEVPEAMALEVAARVRAIMTGWQSGCVRLRADVEVGPTWGTLAKVKV